MRATDSSFIESISYAAQGSGRGDVDVAFKSGKTYRYSDVPAWRYALIFARPSLGSGYNRYLKGVTDGAGHRLFVGRLVAENGAAPAQSLTTALRRSIEIASTETDVDWSRFQEAA